MTDFADPDFDWDAWHAHMMKQIKWLFVMVFITELVTIVALVHWGMWASISLPIVGLGVACGGRYLIWLREHGKLPM